MEETENIPPSENQMDEIDAGYMDEIDDSVFASIDLDGAMISSPNTRAARNLHVELLELLSEALLHSKVRPSCV
jgi:hypothetical protein